jgi:hypothetical protein
VIEAFKWYPIAMLPDNGAGHREHGLNMVVYAPELVNGDCNPHGVAEAYWQDDGLQGETKPGAFIAPSYCLSCDEWHMIEVTPSHFMYLTAPLDAGGFGDYEGVTAYERTIAEESWLKLNSIEVIPAVPLPEALPDAPEADNFIELHMRVADIIRKKYVRHTSNQKLAHDTAMAVLEEVQRTYEMLANAAGMGSN